MAYDLIIRDGTVVDGSGCPRFAADVGIEGDRIVAVGTLGSDARRTIEAAGRVVAPGFIDVHSHDDFALLDRPLCDFKLMQGVTTEVIGNCGFGAAPANDAYKRFLRAFGALLFGPLGDFRRILSRPGGLPGRGKCGGPHSPRRSTLRRIRSREPRPFSPRVGKDAGAGARRDGGRGSRAVYWAVLYPRYVCKDRRSHRAGASGSRVWRSV